MIWLSGGFGCVTDKIVQSRNSVQPMAVQLKIAGTSLYSCLERGTVRVKCRNDTEKYKVIKFLH